MNTEERIDNIELTYRVEDVVVMHDREAIRKEILQAQEEAVRDFANHLAHTIRPREEVYPETFTTEAETYIQKGNYEG